MAFETKHSATWLFTLFEEIVHRIRYHLSDEDDENRDLQKKQASHEDTLDIHYELLRETDDLL